MLAIVSAILNRLHRTPSVTAAIEVSDGRVGETPHRRPRYTMAELLAANGGNQPPDAEDRCWIDAPAVGGECL